METSSQMILGIDQFRPRNRLVPFAELIRKFSEEASLQPNTDYLPELWVDTTEILRNPSSCISLILALVYVRPGWSCNELFENLLRHIFFLSQVHNFQGKWQKVARILQKDLFTSGINGILSRVIEDINSEEFYGNVLPDTYRIIERHLIVRNQVKKLRGTYNRRERLQGIKRKIRRRGYNDKGSTRPLHEHHETGPDWFLDLVEKQRQESLNKYAPPKDPPSRYWYRSLNYGVGPNGAQFQKKEGK